MADLDNEVKVLKEELKWVLKEEVPSQLLELQSLLIDCSRRFPMHVTGVENTVKPEKFLLSVPNSNGGQENIKCVITLLADNICQADIQLRLSKHHGQIFKTSIHPDNPWKLQQLQDAGNHLSKALKLLDAKKPAHNFSGGEEVTMHLREIMAFLHRGRQCLVMPRKKTIQELQRSRNMKVMAPALPNDTAVSFYIQSHKLIFAVYHVPSSHPPRSTFDVYQSECLVPWLNEVLALFTVALQTCQQLKDKISIFHQFADISIPDEITEKEPS